MRFGAHVKVITRDGICMLGNTENGCIIGIDDDARALCERLCNEDIDSSELNEMDPFLRGRLEARDFFKQETTRQRLESLYIHVTSHCNLSCRGCYSFEESRNRQRDLSLQEFAVAIGNLASLNPKRVIVSGGEPFLRKDLPSILGMIRNALPGSYIVVLTNGTVHSGEQVEKVSRYADCISVSIDSPSAASASFLRRNGVFDEAMQMISIAKKTGVSVNILPTLHAKNIHEIERFSTLADALGCSIRFSLLACDFCESEYSSFALGTKDQEILALKAFEIGGISFAEGLRAGHGLRARSICGLGRTTLSMAANGNIYPCHMLHRDECILCNAMDGPIAERIETSLESVGLAELSVSDIEKCSKCDFAFLCGGGCRARAFQTSGDVCACDPYCVLHHEYQDLCLKQVRKMIGERLVRNDAV